MLSPLDQLWELKRRLASVSTRHYRSSQPTCLTLTLIFPVVLYRPRASPSGNLGIDFTSQSASRSLRSSRHKRPRRWQLRAARPSRQDTLKSMRGRCMLYRQGCGGLWVR